MTIKYAGVVVSLVFKDYLKYFHSAGTNLGEW